MGRFGLQGKRPNGRGEEHYSKWKVTPPGPSEPKTITKVINREEREFFWCLGHRKGKGLWVGHDPANCRHLGKSKAKETPSGPNKRPKLTAEVAELVVASESDEDPDE